MKIPTIIVNGMKVRLTREMLFVSTIERFLHRSCEDMPDYVCDVIDYLNRHDEAITYSSI
jgi:hypothetical protein